MTERVKLNLERKKIIPEESTGIKLENDKNGKKNRQLLGETDRGNWKKFKIKINDRW